jgi:uncharacterized protein YbaR (Trm112 family)
MIKIICTSCQKPLSLDETKLPMKEVSFPCPVCKTRLTVDRRNLEMANASPAAAVPAEAPAEEGADDADRFGAKALIVGNDSPALRQAAKLVGFVPIHFAEARQAREYFMQEFPPLVMLNPAQITPPPLEAMAPIVSLAPVDRRKAFFILFADNLRTLDGNAAFLYGVNLVVANKDLAAFPQIYREAFTFHERLYGAYRTVMKEFSSAH